MDNETLNEAVRLNEERKRNWDLRNKAYNRHLYLAVLLGGENVTGEIPDQILGAVGKQLEVHFKQKAQEAEAALEKL